MRNLSLTVICILLLLASLTAQEVTVVPQYPEAGQEVTITYTPTREQAGGDVPTIVFSTSNFYNLAYKMKMNRTGNKWATSFVLPPYAAYASFYIQSGDSIVKPAPDKQFEVPVYKNKVPVENQLLYKGYSLPSQMGRSPAVGEKQAELFQEELKRYPGNYEAKLRLLNYRMGQAQGSAKDSIRRQAEKVIADRFNSKRPPNQGDMSKATMGYIIIGENSRLDSVRKIVRERFPDSEVGRELLTDLIAKEKDTARQIASFEKELKKETIKNAKSFAGMHGRLFKLYAQKRDSAKALYHARFMVKSEDSPYRASGLKNIAQVLLDNGIALDAARGYAERSLKMAEDFPVGLIRYFQETGYILPYADDSTRQVVYNEARGNLLSMIALISMKQGKLQDASEKMEMAVKRSADKETLDNAALFYITTKQAAKLEEIGIIRRNTMKAKVAKQQIKKTAPSLAAFTDLKGNKIDVDSFRNKVLVIDFWATWCMPCMEEMPYVQNIYNKYLNRKDVAFLIVNSASNNTLKDAQNWSGNKKYTFPVYYNTDPNVASKFNFNVIPATFIIDKDGNVRYANVGFEGPEIESRLDLQIESLL